MSSLPLHLTILSIFFSEKDPSFFSGIANETTGSCKPLIVRATKRALFGVGEDVPVTLIEKTPELAELHNQILSRVSGYVSFRAPQFVGDNFSPHVTDQAGRAVSLDTKLELDNLTLLEIEDQNVIVRSTHRLRPVI